jgi:hypothetical protein
LPENIISEQSDDKKIITISIGDVSFDTVPQSITGEGIIKQVELNKYEKSARIIITLLERRNGFNVMKLPFSQALIIEVFD